MKKYVIKATALAIGALVGGSAFAAIDFVTAAPDVTVSGKYASELDYSDAGTAIAAHANTTMKVKLGFGVSQGQQRYVRVDFGGLKLAAAAANTDLVNATAAWPAANVTVVAGGSADDSFVIYQITGAAGGHGASDTIDYAAPALYTTAGNGASPTITYALYETAVAAANNAAGTSLYSKSGTFFNFASGVKITPTAYTNTALVANSYKKFDVVGGTPTTTAAKAEIGKLTVAAAAGVSKATGAAVALADVYAANTKIVFKGDFSPIGAGAGATIESAGCGGVIAGGASTSISTDKQTVTWTAGAVANLASLALCWATDNTVAIPAQTFTYDVNPVAAAASVTVADPAAATIGTVVRDGTELQAPFATIHPDYLSRVVLTSQYSLDAAYTMSAITETGVTCTAGPKATGTLKKGEMLVLNVSDICSSLSTGTRLAVKAIVAAPLSTVHGLYNVMNYDQVTGKTNSLISYPMVRPTEN